MRDGRHRQGRYLSRTRFGLVLTMNSLPPILASDFRMNRWRTFGCFMAFASSGAVLGFIALIVIGVLR
jgi:hypothetical protein